MNLSAKERLSECLKRLQGGKSRRALAREIGVSATAVMQWESGDAEPSHENMVKIASLLGLTVDEFGDYLKGSGRRKELPKAERMISQLSSLSRDDIAKIVHAGVEMLSVGR